MPAATIPSPEPIALPSAALAVVGSGRAGPQRRFLGLFARLPRQPASSQYKARRTPGFLGKREASLRDGLAQYNAEANGNSAFLGGTSPKGQWGRFSDGTISIKRNKNPFVARVDFSKQGRPARFDELRSA